MFLTLLNNAELLFQKLDTYISMSFKQLIFKFLIFLKYIFRINLPINKLNGMNAGRVFRVKITLKINLPNFHAHDDNYVVLSL